MTPAARVQATIEVLATWLTGSEGLDRVLAAWGRSHRFAGSKDRRAIADHAYAAVRRLRSSAWMAGGSEDAARDIVRGSLLLDGAEIGALFDGSQYGPAAVSSDEQHPARPLAEAPRAVRLDLPDWLGTAFSDVADEELELLRVRAPVDLRVNLMKSDRAQAIALLAAEGIVTQPGPLADTALRVIDGAPRVATSRAYADGIVEVQDAASQVVAQMAAPQPGERVLDLCAGGGGKTLAMGALMEGSGQLDAFDVTPARMKDLPLRAARAGLAVRCLEESAVGVEGPYDLVLVDAPCSGSGAWRRNPDAKWRLDIDRLASLHAIQREILVRGAALVAPEGRLVYATCSILASENVEQIGAFLGEQPSWWECSARRLSLLEGGDGFYVSVLSRR